MRKLTNKGSLRAAAGLLARRAGVSLKDKTIVFYVTGFTGEINHTMVSNEILFNKGHKWYYVHNGEPFTISDIHGTFETIFVI